MTNTGVAGSPGEFFWRDFQPGWSKQWGVSDPADYLNKAVEHGSTPNGVFGAKIMIYGGYIEDLLDILLRLPEHKGTNASVTEVIAHTFPNSHYVWITRRNKVRQAVSHCRASQTGIWRKGDDASGDTAEKPEFKFEAVDRAVQEIVMQEAAWQEFLSQCGITPMVVVYEDFIEALGETVTNILDFLGVPVPSSQASDEARMQKQGDELSDRWV